MRIPSGTTDQYIYFVAVDATDFTSRETGLSSFTVYRSRNGGAAVAMTTPTINETDTTNMPGVYELLLDEDMTIGSGNDSEEMCFHITHAGMAPVTRTIELYRPKMTVGQTAAVSANRIDAVVQSMAAGTLTASALATDAVQEIRDAITGGAYALDTDANGRMRIVDGTGPGELNTNLGLIAGIAGTKNTFDDLNDVSAADVNTQCDTALSDIGLDHLISSSLPTNWTTDVAAGSVFAEIGGVTFSTASDSLEAIRDRGDAAWTTGAGGSDRLLMVDTTIATLASQTSFTLTDGSADDDAYNGCTIVIEDASTATQKATGIISDYTGSTRTVTLLYDPAIFTMAATDKVYILAERGLKPSSAAGYYIDVTVAGHADVNVHYWDDVQISVTSPFDAVATAAELAKVPKSDGTASWNATALAAINAEADTAISDAALATASALATAQTDLDILTGTDGVTLATSQPNYAPNTVVPMAAAVSAADHDTTQAAIAALNNLSQADIRTAVGLSAANLDTQLGYITDYTAYGLTILAGAISNAQNTAEVYSKTLNGVTYTVTYAGLDVTGNRTSSALSKV